MTRPTVNLLCSLVLLAAAFPAVASPLRHASDAALARPAGESTETAAFRETAADMGGKAPKYEKRKGELRAYALFDNSGREITFEELIDRIAPADAVFVGEIHNCPITHWLELEITRALYARHGKRLVMGAEMLESDTQLILDEYMQRLISPERFGAEARLWDNYETDYHPIVFFAKEHGLPFVATNAPRR